MMQVHQKNFDQIVSQGRQLAGQCDGQTSVKINEITHRIQQQWSDVERRLQEIIQPSRDVVEHWRQFNNSYVHLLDRLSELETRWYTIQREKFTTDIETLMEKATVKIEISSRIFQENKMKFSGISTTFATIGQRNC